MELYIKVSGKIKQERDMVGKYGLMVQYIRECGLTEWLTVKEDLFTQEAMCMKEIGLMIELKEKEYIYIGMEHLIQVNG